jgi:hypothetical protein
MMAEAKEPFYTDIEDEDDFSLELEESDRVPLRHGEAMTSNEVERFLLAKPANLVSIVGETLSGKTTLMCALYDRFLKGPFAGFTFAGSRTIVGLERRSHYSRVDSGYSVPETERTSLSDDLLHYHFALVPTDAPEQRLNLFLSDRAGESYQMARSNTDLVKNLPELQRSKRIVILLDGSKVADKAERSGAMQNVRQLMQAFLDNDALGIRSRVQLVTTKKDVLEKAGDADILAGRLTDFRNRLASDFSPRLGELLFAEIAARDPTGGHPVGAGVNELLRTWMQGDAAPVPSEKPLFPLPSSEMDRLLLRTRLEEWP